MSLRNLDEKDIYFLKIILVQVDQIRAPRKVPSGLPNFETRLFVAYLATIPQ